MRIQTLTALLLFTASVPAAAQSRRDDGRTFNRHNRDGLSDRVDTTVAFQAGGLVALSSNQGNIVVHTGSANTVVVHANSERGRIRFDASSDRVSVDASDAGDGRIEVTVPAGVRVTAQSREGDVQIRGTGADVSVHTQNGDVSVENASGQVDFNTLSGDIVAAQLKGTISASSVSGDIRLTDVNGNLSGSTVSGDVTFQRVTSQSVTANTTSGDIGYDGTIDAAGRYAFAAHSGDISLAIPAAASAQLTVSTWSGSIDSDFPITLQPGEHAIGVENSKRFTFTIGGGEARVRAESFNGDIVIHRRGNR
jgi:DUF4097 and DUF4098 domain-containing protein YvlB